MIPLLVAAVLTSTPTPTMTQPLPADACPQEGETALDCPWAGIGRAAAAAPDAQAVLNSSAPAVMAEIEADSKTPGLLDLWGRSVNFDEHAKATIIAPPILDALFAAADAPSGHAGITHCYGYLFSVLKTPYGFKRARWVEGAIERGLGLPEGTFSPVPKKGTLLSNLTAFIGRVAFRGDPKELKAAEKLGKFSVKNYKPRRLTESLTLEGGRKLTIRVDLVPYTVGKGSLLIYSWRDETDGRAYLITAFPVDEGFAGSLFDPNKLGEGKPIVARYNAAIDGVTGVSGLTGVRKLE